MNDFGPCVQAPPSDGAGQKVRQLMEERDALMNRIRMIDEQMKEIYDICACWQDLMRNSR